MQSVASDRNTGAGMRRLVALALIALVAGCSSVRVGYNHADTLLVYTFDKYLDLNEPQQRLLRERIRALVTWHRATQLLGYAQFLEAAAQRVDEMVSADQVLALNLEMNRRLVMVGDQAAPDLAALALSLEPTQLERLARHLADDDAKSRREAGSPDGHRRREKHEQRSIDRAEEWFGSVSPQQRRLIHDALVARPDGDDWWVTEREQRRADLLGLVTRIQAQRPPLADAAAALRDYFAHLAEPADPQRRQRMAAYRRGNAELIAALINAATPQQKASLHKKLRGYADDFASLAGAGSHG
jgi:Family of unknown function (DUF6279)